MEIRVAGYEGLAVGTMRKVTVGDGSCLLLRTADGYRAFPASCPHYHGPLHLGLLDDHRLTCPWHQAVFDVRDGDLLEPPSFFGLPSYPVRLEDGDVVVTVPDDDRGTRSMPMAQPDLQSDPRTVLLVGAGAAGGMAAESLRQAGYAGRIVMVSAEDKPPYDRPNCSKDLLAGSMPASWMPLRSPKFYEKHGVERRRSTVVSAEVAERTVILDDGSELTAEAMLLAPGGTPRTIDVPGSDLDGVFTLRSWSDCEAIVAALEGAGSVAVVGASFIGLEVAASLRHRDLSVTVLAPEEVPFARLFGSAVGAAFRDLHARQGVTLRLGASVVGFSGERRVRAVALADGHEVPADVVVMGIGVRPATDFIHGAEKLSNGAVVVDDHLRVAPGVWAAGDVAAWPAVHLGDRVRIEHWRLALQHGRAAAFDIAGHGRPFAGVPFFWTQQYDTSFRYAGYGGDPREAVIAGDPAAGDFVAFYPAHGRPAGVLGTRDLQVAAFAELMHQGALPSFAELRERPDLDLCELLR